MMLVLQKKVSWTLLTLFFIFDNIFSYYVVTRLHGREANLAIAPLVERYPLLYFACIPAEIGIMIIVVRIIQMIIRKTPDKRRYADEGMLERIILEAFVTYWAVGNSSMNLAFLLGHRLPIWVWSVTSCIGIVFAVSYGLIAIYAFKRRESV